MLACFFKLLAFESDRAPSYISFDLLKFISIHKELQFTLAIKSG